MLASRMMASKGVLCFMTHHKQSFFISFSSTFIILGIIGPQNHDKHRKYPKVPEKLIRKQTTGFKIIFQLLAWICKLFCQGSFFSPAANYKWGRAVITCLQDSTWFINSTLRKYIECVGNNSKGIHDNRFFELIFGKSPASVLKVPAATGSRLLFWTLDY